MRVTTRCVCATGDIWPSIRQVDAVFGKIIVKRAGSLPDFELLKELVIFTSIGPWADKPTRSARQGIYYVTQPIPYQAWITSDWAARIDLMASAFLAGLEAAPKKRFLDFERTAMRDIADAVRQEALKSPPAPVERIIPAFPHVAAVAPAEERLFKLYQRIDGRLHYREAWNRDNHVVTEHWGACGEKGDARQHACASATEARARYQSLKREARDAGFRSISLARHATLVVEIGIKGMGCHADLDRRHALEDFLDQQTGWLGLGHCDGGSSGSGSMEAFCYVVDFEIAKTALTEALRKSPFSDFTRIYRVRR